MLPIFILNLQPNLVKTKAGTLAQMVEQRTENPCVPGSIPGGTTIRETKRFKKHQKP